MFYEYRQNNSARTIFVGILVIAVLVAAALGIGIWFGNSQPFEGEFENAGLFLVKGTITEAKSFQTSGFKFLVKVEAVEVVPPDKGIVVTGLPEVGDVVTVDVEDSRFNLFVDSIEGKRCTGDAVQICEYIVTEQNITLVICEEIGSSGLPEFSGTPK